MSVAEEVEAPELSTGKHQDPKLTVVPDSPTTANQESGYSPEHPWYTGGGALEDIAGIAGAVESKSWLVGLVVGCRYRIDVFRSLGYSTVVGRSDDHGPL